MRRNRNRLVALAAALVSLPVALLWATGTAQSEPVRDAPAY